MSFTQPRLYMQESSLTNARPNLIVVLLLLLLPMERIVLPFQLRIVDGVIIILFFYLLFLFQSRFELICFPMLQPFALILVASVLSILTGSQYEISIVAVVQELYLFGAFLILANILSTYTFPVVEKLFTIWAVVAAAVSITCIMGMIGIGPSMFYTSPIDSVVLSIGAINRANGTYVNPNAAAAYLSISFFICLAIPRSIYMRFIISSLVFCGIVATGSLGGMSTTLMSLGLLILVYYRFRCGVSILNRRRILITICLLIVFFVTVFVMFNMETGSPTNNRSDLAEITIGRFNRSFGDRVALTLDFWEFFKERPLGTGPNTAELYVKDLHNDYIAYLFERGPLGFIGWIWLITYSIRVSLAMARAHGTNSRCWQYLSLTAALVACSLNAMAHETSHFRQLWVLLAFIYGLQLSLRRHPIKSYKNLWTDKDEVAPTLT